jgi:hypothetical protein
MVAGMPLLVGRLPPSVLPPFAVTAFAHFFGRRWKSTQGKASLDLSPLARKVDMQRIDMAGHSGKKNIRFGMNYGVGSEKHAQL